MSEMSDPINNPPSYYLLSDGTEIREMIRQARGDESTIEHLAQSIMEYASRLGKKPGASRADDFHKIARCAIQGANVCEGRSVSDNGAPPTGPADPDLGWVAGYVRRNRILHLYGRSNDLCDDVACGGQFEAALVGGVQLHPVHEPAPTPAPTPPPEPSTIDLSRVVGMLTRHGVVHLYERKDDLRAAMDSPDGWDRVMWTDGVRLHPADEPDTIPTPAPPIDHRMLVTAISRAIEILTFARDIQAAVNVLTDAVGSESTLAPTPPPEPERPSVALPVVFAGEKTARSGLYIEVDSKGTPRRAFLGKGYEAESTLLGPIPPACEWPTKPEGEGVPPPEPEPVLDQYEDGAYLPTSLKACHARIKRLDRELTEASEHLQKVIGHGVGILCVADAAKAIVEPLLKPHVTLPVVFGGDRIPANGVYLALDSRGNQMVDGWAGGYSAPSTMIGPLPSERGWPKRSEGEPEVEDA